MLLLKNFLKKSSSSSYQDAPFRGTDNNNYSCKIPSQSLSEKNRTKQSSSLDTLFKEKLSLSDLYPKKDAFCPCGSGKKYKKCCEENEKTHFCLLEKGLIIVPDEQLFALEDKKDTACLRSCALDLNHQNVKSSIKKLLSLMKKYPTNNSISFLLALAYRLLPDLSAFQKLLTSLKHQETYLPLKLLRWWYIFDYGSGYAAFSKKMDSLTTIAPDRKEFCLTEFCLWGLIRILKALDQGRYIEGEAHFLSLIKTAEQLGSPNHWALENAEILLQSAYSLRRLKLKKI